MQKILKKQKIVLAVLVLLVCALVGAIYVLFSILQKTQIEVLAAKNTAAELADTADKHTVSSGRVATIAQRVQTLDTLILDKNSIPQYLERLENLAATNDVVFDVTNVDTSIRDDTQRMSVSFSIKGSQVAVQSFLDALGRQPQAGNFVQLNISFGPSMTASGSGILEILSFK
jgi:FPC/CPF motif-containing protein YcgG